MRKRRTFFVDIDGEIYKFSRRSWLEWLVANWESLRDRGAPVLPFECGGRFVGMTEGSALDWSSEDFHAAVLRLQDE